jgi:arylsulfatase A-like enzyme
VPIYSAQPFFFIDGAAWKNSGEKSVTARFSLDRNIIQVYNQNMMSLKGNYETKKRKGEQMAKELKRRDFLKILGFGVGRRPNILYIMSDDHATNAISCYGGMLNAVSQTPNIDRIASEGVRLDNCFVTNSICTPSRACIMTGKYSHRNGVYTLGDVDFDREQQNVAILLQQSGYQTAVIGKWHLFTKPSGFDYYNVLPEQGRYYDPLLKEKGWPWSDGNQGGREYKGYSTDVITNEALKWLRQRDREKPFFLMCHYKAPHGLWKYAKRYEHMFDGIDIPEPASLWEDKSHRSAGSREYGRNILTLSDRMNRTTRGKEWPTGRLDTTGMSDREKVQKAYQKYMKDYLRVAAAVDENVGRVLDWLDEEGLVDNTIVIYTSDQGMFLGEHNYYDKRWMFDESLRMPFLVRYPPEIRAGSVNNDIIINADFAETFLDWAGAAVPPDMQGRSFRGNLAGRTPSDWRTAMYYRYWMQVEDPNVPAHYGIRTKQYKLIFYYGLPLGMEGATESWCTNPGWELYDLKKDPLELHNVYDEPAYSKVVSELKTELLRLKEELGDTDDKYPELMSLVKKHW